MGATLHSLMSSRLGALLWLVEGNGHILLHRECIFFCKSKSHPLGGEADGTAVVTSVTHHPKQIFHGVRVKVSGEAYPNVSPHASFVSPGSIAVPTGEPGRLGP